MKGQRFYVSGIGHGTVFARKDDEVLVRIEPFTYKGPDGKDVTVNPTPPWRTAKVADLTPA